MPALPIRPSLIVLQTNHILLIRSRGLWKDATKAIGADIELYQARHSVASMAASSGVSIAIIKEVLGHADIGTTQRYSHVDVLAQSQVFAAQDRTEHIHRGQTRIKKREANNR